ncbi:hypothetical protein [Streptomyces sp. NBC_00872]|uniref:hypothetical protein n=1 Tax=Streptomyces sp. NBC_00872 TaxID=2903686 RepID=UPI0038692748|nr:hypothetical protein OG214_18875 [Streptomyces sp. NBC_00872]
MEVDLDERGRLLVPGTGTIVAANRVGEYLARNLRIPERATDIYVYVHGWQTAPGTASRTAARLVQQAQALRAAGRERYPGVARGFRPWVVVVRWPSSSVSTLGGFRRIRERAHAMSALGTGHAPFVLAHLLGYLDVHRAHPENPAVLTNRSGQYLHLVGHSFGGRFLCEAVQWATERPVQPRVLGWSTPVDPRRPFTVDSALIFQMAAPRDAFVRHFAALFPSGGAPGAPLRGPLVLTHSRWDRATGFWHLRAEGEPGIGHSGTGATPVPQSTIRMLTTRTAYARRALDHRIVNVDAGWLYRGGWKNKLSPSGAHSDFQHPESAHLLLTLASLSR